MLWAETLTSGFTQEDRERLVRVEVTLQQMEKRFEQIDKRFEQVDKRFEELREDMNKRFDQTNLRFQEQQSFLQMMVAFLGALFVAVFGFAYWDRHALLSKAKEEAQAVARTEASQVVTERESNLAAQATEQAVARIEKEGRLRDLILALRQLALRDVSLAQVLREFHLL